MHILLVDDHQLFSDGLRFLLRELSPDTRLTSARSIGEAHRMVDAYDLILLDLHLPDAQGAVGVDRIRMVYESTPLVVVSSEENPQMVHECIRRGAMGFVPKSSSGDALFEALHHILNGKTYLPRGCLELVETAPAVAAPPLDTSQFSRRQWDVLLKVIQGKPNKTIALELGISAMTVKTHVTAVLNALQVSNRTEAVYRAAAMGIAAPPDGS